MLHLKCVICLDILRHPSREPATAPCGHIYCRNCLDRMARTREKTSCALCRFPFQITAAIKLFLEHEEGPPKASTSNTLSTSQKESINTLIVAAGTIDDQCGEEEVLNIVVDGEKVLVDLFQTETETESEGLLRSLEASLEGIRKRLKLFTRVNELTEKIISLTAERDSLRQVVIDQAREVEEAAQVQSRLESQLKRTNIKLELFQHKERSKLAARKLTVETLTEELEMHKAKLLKFKKKYHAASQEVESLRKLADHQKRVDYLEQNEAVPQLSDNDDSLEITTSAPSHGSRVRSIADDKSRLKAEIAQANIPDKYRQRMLSGQDKPKGEVSTVEGR